MTVTPQTIVWGLTPGTGGGPGSWWVPGTAITNGVIAGAFGTISNGTAYKAFPDGQDMDITPVAGWVQPYSFSAATTKYPLTLTASTNGTAVDLSANTPEFCVGQQVTFSLNGLPMGNIVNMVGQWILPAKYVNSKLQYVIGVTSPNYDIASGALQNTNQTSCWFVNGSGGQVSVTLSLLFNNGQYTSVAAFGNITVYRPSYTNFSTTNSTLGFTNASRSFLWDGDVLSYGNETNGADGQFWSAIINSKYNGAIGILQLVNAVYTRNYGELSSYNTLDTGGTFWLDGSPTTGYQDPNNYQEFTYLTDFISSHKIWISDQPEGNIFGLYLGDNVRLWGQFIDYLRFQPSGSGSIAVTLATNTWSMEGMATTGSGITTNSTPLPSAPLDSDAFPIWTLIKSGK
jgi:hypothetical protein